jgi:hypothetical protein
VILDCVGPVFKFFRCFKDFRMQKVYPFLEVNASLLWLNNVSSMYLIQASLLLIGQQGLRDFFSYQPLLPIG